MKISECESSDGIVSYTFKTGHIVESRHLHKSEKIKQNFASVYTKSSLAIKNPLGSLIVSIPQSKVLKFESTFLLLNHQSLFLVYS